jgi:polyhydroxyalkanoate synthesis regulator phasin
VIGNVTSEMTKENDRMRQEFSSQLQTEVQSIAKEVEVVRKSTGMELTNCVQNFESVCDRMNESMNAYKSQTDA